MQGGATAATGDAPGAHLGKFQLIRRLATGGMAEIFLARSQAIHGFEKLLVLKRILPQHAESEDFIHMFLAEARLAARLHHPNIVQVYDIGEESGTYFFTMEYIQGQDLRRLVRAARRNQVPIPLEHILHIVMGMAGGLHHAHEQTGADGELLGIVHRDVSPSNVLVTYEGDVKVVDFGIAKAAAVQVSTIAGTLKGKIPYMSPEQCRGEAVDRRSDLFSIGTLLWELTTGKRLFAGENEFAILNRVAKADVPPPSSIHSEYPPELERIVMRALSVDPDDRYPTAIDMQIELEDFVRECRLPVSSARMGRFMRSLFEEEIRVSADELRDAQAFADEASQGTSTISVPSRGTEGLADLTPSELRVHASPTPGLVSEEFGADSGTDISVTDPLTRSARGSAVAVGAGFLLTLGFGGGLWLVTAENRPEASRDVAPPTSAAPNVSDPPSTALEASPGSASELSSAAASAGTSGLPGTKAGEDRSDTRDGSSPDSPAAVARSGPGAGSGDPDEDRVVGDGGVPAQSKPTSGTSRTRRSARRPKAKAKPKPKPKPQRAATPETAAGDATSSAKPAVKKRPPKYDEDSARLPGF